MGKSSEWADRGRELAERGRIACLCTLHRGAGTLAEFPFASIVPYRLASDGSPIVFISKIAEHYKNLEADARASLLVTDAFASGEMNRARLTIMARFVPSAAGEHPEIEQSLFSLVPSEIGRNFALLMGEIVRLRWIGGFADAGWIEPETWKEAFTMSATRGA